MVSCHSANWAVGVDVLVSLTLVALSLEQAASLHKVIFSAVLAGAFKLA